ncbi:MAG: hypothetical protein AB1646_17395 [Thermodesulfobacteriota bacterium]
MSADPVGMVFAGYNSGPSRKGILLPVGSCLCFDASRRIILTASHVLEKIPATLPRMDVEIVPQHHSVLVGISLGDLGWRIFLVRDHVELLPEVTALYVDPVSVDGKAFPGDMAFPVAGQPIHEFWPVHMIGYPASIQNYRTVPDEDMMEVQSYDCSNIRYSVSGTVCAYFKNQCPHFIPTELLRAFTVDNGVLPGMSGGAVLSALPHKHEVVGMIVKNVAIEDKTQTPGYGLVHTLAVSIHDILV